MKRFLLLFSILLLAGCEGQVAEQTGTLAEARKDFKSQLVNQKSNAPVDVPPPHVFSLVQYPSPVGDLPAYLTPDPGDGQKRPAIVWITGGDCNTIGNVWDPATPDNDQTAAAYRQAGIVMMFPSLRGGNQNPGYREGFLGEVDDVLAAADYLARQEHVDPQRIYLGGHSTGGTLVLLVSEMSDRFRAVFAFGAVDEVDGYDPEYLPFNYRDSKEVLHTIKSPTFAIEGENGNISSLNAMRRHSKNPQAHFVTVRGAEHFSVLAPTNQLLAQKILADTGQTANISVTDEELSRLFGR